MSISDLKWAFDYAVSHGLWAEAEAIHAALIKVEFSAREPELGGKAK